MTEINYADDSLAEIIFSQQEAIEQQGYRILHLLMENHALRENPAAVIALEHERLEEALLLVEGWTFRQLKSGEEWMNARAMYRVLQEVLDYSDTATVPPWFEAAREAHAAEMREEE